MKHALLALAGIAVGLPAMAALASINGQTTGGLPARYVPWTHAGRRIHTATLGTPRRTPSPTARTAPEAPPRRPPAERQIPRSARHREPRHGRPPASPQERPSPPQPEGPPIQPPPQETPAPPGSGLGGLLPRPRQAADLRLSITAPAVVRPRGAFTYAIRLANRGPGTPGAITVRSLLPAGVVRTGSSLPDGVGGYADGRDATLVLGRLPPGRSMTARFRVRVRPDARDELVAWSGISYIGDVRDRRPRDNIATVTTRIDRRT
jgi:hypothetical protein